MVFMMAPQALVVQLLVQTLPACVHASKSPPNSPRADGTDESTSPRWRGWDARARSVPDADGQQGEWRGTTEPRRSWAAGPADLGKDRLPSPVLAVWGSGFEIAVGDRPRGRPPAQIPACATNALGSCLGCERRSVRRGRGAGRRRVVAIVSPGGSSGPSSGGDAGCGCVTPRASAGSPVSGRIEPPGRCRVPRSRPGGLVSRCPATVLARGLARAGVA